MPGKIGSRGPLPKDRKANVVDVPGNKKTGDAKDQKSKPKQSNVNIKMPDFVDFQADAKRCWKSTIETLKKYGLLSRLDKTSIQAYCLAYGEKRKLQRYLNKEGYSANFKNGRGYDTIRIRPEVNRLNSLENLCLRYEEQFGLTPKSRQRLDIKEPDERNSSDSKEERNAEKVFGSKG